MAHKKRKQKVVPISKFGGSTFKKVATPKSSKNKEHISKVGTLTNSTLKTTKTLKSNTQLKRSSMTDKVSKDKKKARDEKGREKWRASPLNEGKPDTNKEAAKDRAITSCHTFVRYRDRNERCISCGGELGDEYHAGHMLEAGNNTELKFHKDNIHAQCVHCNITLNGNRKGYEPRLRRKIGNERVDWLIMVASQKNIVKRDEADYREIAAHFNTLMKDCQLYAIA